MGQVFYPISHCGSEPLPYNALYHGVCRSGDIGIFVTGSRRVPKPHHREGSFLLNSVGKLPFTTYLVCTTEAQLTENTWDGVGVTCLWAWGGACSQVSWEKNSRAVSLPRRGHTEPSSGDRCTCAGACSQVRSQGARTCRQQESTTDM